MAVSDAKTLAAWERGIRVLLVTGKQGEAAKAAGVNDSTWAKWREEEPWQRLFDMRREQASRVAVEEMGALFHQAKEVLLEAMGEGYDIGTRVRAAEKVLTFVARAAPNATGAAPHVVALAENVSGADAAEELRRRRLGQPIDVTPPSPLEGDESETGDSMEADEPFDLG